MEAAATRGLEGWTAQGISHRTTVILISTIASAAMCNLYAIMKHRAEIAGIARAMSDRNNNQPPQPNVFPA